MFRPLPYLFSQYYWIVLFAAVLGICIVFDTKENFIFHSAEVKKKWNKTSDPFVFSHDSDIHINSKSESSQANFKTILKTAAQYHSKFHIITGDLSDNFNRLQPPKYSDQHKESWIDYQRIIKESRIKYRIIECPGNHDMWGLKSFDSNRFYMLDYSSSFKRESTLSLDSFRVKVIKEQFPIIILSPFNFPTAHSCLLFWIEPSKEILDNIEVAVNNNPGSIVICHHPLDMWRSTKSTTGKTIRDILGSPNVKLILTGHTHPKRPEIRHHGQGIMEVVGVGGMNHHIFGAITQDNGRIVYHKVDTKNPPICLITHPVPINQINYHTSLNEANTEIRIICTKGSNLSIKINGSITGKMKYIRKTKDGFYLYTYPLKLSDGHHQLYFSGDFIASRSFVIGSTYELIQENKISSMHVTNCFVGSAVALFILLSFIVLPFNIFNCRGFNDWIQGRNDSQQWILSIFCGFLAVRSRILTAPFFIRIPLFIAAIWPICLPTVIMEVDNQYGFIFSYGYVINGIYHYTNWGVFYSLLYLTFVVLSVILFVSGFSERNCKNWIFYFDMLFAICLFVIGIAFSIIKLLSESSGMLLMLVSPAYTFIPLVLLICSIIWVIQSRKTSTSYFPVYPNIVN